MKWFRTTDWASWYQNKKPQSWKWLILESIIYTKHLFKALWAYVVVSLLETAYFFRVPFSTWKWGWISSKKLWWWCPAFVTLLNNHMDFGNFGSRQLNNGHHIHKLIGMADTVPQRPYIPLCLPDLGLSVPCPSINQVTWSPWRERAEVKGGGTMVTKEEEEEAASLGSDRLLCVSVNWRNSQQSHF